jgi:hypothetical protein
MGMLANDGRHSIKQDYFRVLSVSLSGSQSQRRQAMTKVRVASPLNAVSNEDARVVILIAPMRSSVSRVASRDAHERTARPRASMDECPLH